MLKKDLYSKLFAGVDESRHGLDNEVFTIVVSPLAKDAERYLISKNTRINSKDKDKILWIPLQERDYRYALVNRSHYKKYGQHQLIKEITRELVASIKPEYNEIELYIDGDLTSKQRGAIKREVAKVAYIKYPEIGVHSIAKRRNKENKFETNYLLVTADSLANFLSRNYSPKELQEGEISRNRVLFN